MNGMDYLLLSDPGTAPAATVTPLVVRGQFFCLATGEAWTAIESSEFSLYKRYLDGENLTPILTERRELGFNLLRVWLLNTSVIPGGLLPSQYPDFYDKLHAFLRLCAGYGFYVELTAFTQTQTLMPLVSEQQAHWQQVIDGVRGEPNVLLELVNEADQHDNRTDPSLLQMKPSGVLASSGSNGADSPPPTPVWDYVLYHSNDLDQWHRKVGHNCMEWSDFYKKPGMSNENTRYTDRDSSDVHTYDAAAGASLLCSGACFHSNGGKLSTLFSADEKRCAVAWVAGAKSVPLEFRTGVYSHRSDLEGPTVLKAYQRQLPDGRSYIVKIRP